MLRTQRYRVSGVNAFLTEEGWQVVVATAPGHVRTVRENVFDLLTSEQLAVLDEVFTSVLAKLDSAPASARPAPDCPPADC